MLSQELEGSAIDVVAFFVEAPLLYGADVGRMREHGVFEVERDDLAGQCGKGYIEVDAESLGRYVISSRVKSWSMLISAEYSGER